MLYFRRHFKISPLIDVIFILFFRFRFRLMLMLWFSMLISIIFRYNIFSDADVGLRRFSLFRCFDADFDDFIFSIFSKDYFSSSSMPADWCDFADARLIFHFLMLMCRGCWCHVSMPIFDWLAARQPFISLDLIFLRCAFSSFDFLLSFRFSSDFVGPGQPLFHSSLDCRYWCHFCRSSIICRLFSFISFSLMITFFSFAISPSIFSIFHRITSLFFSFSYAFDYANISLDWLLFDADYCFWCRPALMPRGSFRFLRRQEDDVAIFFHD